MGERLCPLELVGEGSKEAGGSRIDDGGTVVGYEGIVVDVEVPKPSRFAGSAREKVPSSKIASVGWVSVRCILSRCELDERYLLRL